MWALVSNLRLMPKLVFKKICYLHFRNWFFLTEEICKNKSCSFCKKSAVTVCQFSSVSWRHLSVLRSGVKATFAWMLDRYFIPTDIFWRLWFLQYRAAAVATMCSMTSVIVASNGTLTRVKLPKLSQWSLSMSALLISCHRNGPRSLSSNTGGCHIQQLKIIRFQILSIFR